MRRFVAVGVAAAALAGNTETAPLQTEWGDPDLTGTWPVQRISDARIRLERPEQFAGRAELSDAEFAERLAEAERSDSEFEPEEEGTRGLADWLRSTPFARRSSLVVDPADGRLPPLTDLGAALFATGRSTRVGELEFDWVTDFDPFERCITRGFPAVMLPQPYNNGLRIFQSPGYVVLQMETFGVRVIPLGQAAGPPPAVRAWHGMSRGHWDGDTLVVETTNIVSGDSASHDRFGRAAGPIPGRENAVLPVGPDARVVERFRRIGHDSLAYRVTYEDPAIYTAPWAVELERQSEEDYVLYEYACQEGDTSIRAVIEGSRADRRAASEE